jgi:thiamine pyrophosphokinase
MLLARTDLADVNLWAYASGWWFCIITPHWPVRFHAPPGATVSLIPMSARVSGIRSEGLQYPLPAAWERGGGVLTMGSGRGMSNRVTASCVTISIRRGALLLVHGDRHVVDAAGTSQGSQEVSHD